jgi:hypothetical protein
LRAIHDLGVAPSRTLQDMERVIGGIDDVVAGALSFY